MDLVTREAACVRDRSAERSCKVSAAGGAQPTDTGGQP